MMMGGDEEKTPESNWKLQNHAQSICSVALSDGEARLGSTATTSATKIGDPKGRMVAVYER